jgi:hypothetical protein
MSRDKSQDDKDWEAIRARRQQQRDAARGRAHETAAAAEAAQTAKADKKAKDEFEMLLGLAESMSDAELNAAIKKHGKRGKRGKLSSKQKEKLKNAQEVNKGCLSALALMALAAGGLLYGMYEGATAIASALF